MALRKLKEFSRKSGDSIDPFHLKCEITVKKNSDGEAYMVRAAINTGQFDEDGNESKPLSVEYWDFTQEMKDDPKGKVAVRDYKLIMEEARQWLAKEINIYKYPSH